MPTSYFKNSSRGVRSASPPRHSRGVNVDSDSSATGSDVDCESTTEGIYPLKEDRGASDEARDGEYHETVAMDELVFLCRMECISQMKAKIEKNDGLLLGDVEAFREDLQRIKALWNQVTLEDLEFAARSSGKHLAKLFDMLTVRVPQVSVSLDDPLESGEKKLYKLVRELPHESLFYSALRGRRKFFPYKASDDADDIECLWNRQATNSCFARRFSSDDWRVQVEVDVVGVGLMRETEEDHVDFADILIMMVLAKFPGYATSANAMLYMCWQKQIVFYLVNVMVAVVSIVALIDITVCTKLLGCSEAAPGSACCADSGLDHNFSPLVVLGAGLWFLVSDIMYAAIILRETNYLKNVLQSSKVFEFLLEAISTIMTVNMVTHGWTFARHHYIQFFLVVSTRWLHLLYNLLPLPVVGRTVLPMYQAVFSYESKAFIVVNLVILAGSFQAYISLRSDINANNIHGSLMQPIADALLAQYRLNFLGDFSVDEMRGESLEIKNDIISTRIGQPDQRQGVALFMVVVTFIQAVLMLNLYIGILGESYSYHKQRSDSEFMQFRANFMLKNLCLLRFFNNLGLKRLNTYLACYKKFAEADVVWAITPMEAEEGATDPPVLCPDLSRAIGEKPLADLEQLMEKLGRKRKTY